MNPILNVDYLFGVPSQIKTGGIHLGMTASALEHQTPEQMFNTDPLNPTQGISAVKALQLASQQGQNIYTITAANQATTLPNIHHDSATMSKIEQAINKGKEVITHTDAVTVPAIQGRDILFLTPLLVTGRIRLQVGRMGAYVHYYF